MHIYVCKNLQCLQRDLATAQPYTPESIPAHMQGVIHCELCDKPLTYVKGPRITKVRVRDDSIYVKPDGGKFACYSVVFERDGKPRKLKGYFSTRKEAREAAAQLKGR